VGATNSALLATEQGVTKQRRVWFIANGQLHGGESGYLMSVTYLTKKIPGSRNDLQKIGLRCYYEGKQTAPITSVVPI